LFANKPDVAREFEAETPENAKLPNRAEKKINKKRKRKKKPLRPIEV